MISYIIKRLATWQACFAVILMVGIGLRLWGLGQSGIFFYDEAMYLGHSLDGLEFLSRNQAAAASDLGKALNFYLQFPLNFTKPIWILIVDSRYFLSHIHDWDYAKYASCLFGVLTLPLAFVFARKYFKSVAIACLSMAILAVMPGPVFYSRIGLQEALSTFLVLSGLYFYLFPRDFGKKTFLAGLFLGMAYLSNYRLIVLPGLLVVIELWLGLLNKEGIRWRHCVWACVMFLVVMVLVGSCMGGIQMRYTFAWIFHQQDMSIHQKAMQVGLRHWTEIFAYPYYLFRLENGLLAAAFFGAVYFFIKRHWKSALLFVVVIVQMFLFSFASDRGARYIAVVLPLVAMSSAALLYAVYQDVVHPHRRVIFVGFLVFMFAGLLIRSVSLITDVSAYRPSVEFLTERDAHVKFLSSQQIVQRLYLKDRKNVRDIPVNFEDFYRLYAQGFRYLVLDPQAYIGFPGHDYKWTLPLAGYLSFIDRQAQPLKTFAHFNRAVMERVVFEHSDALFESIRFLDSKDLDKMSSLRVYDIATLLPVMMSVANSKNNKALPR
ncbi:MAG: phospholipid carrier-dependent glycosyltransferase [Candidatus Omnitrophota bacterium]